jgi:hypothetical protein
LTELADDAKNAYKAYSGVLLCLEIKEVMKISKIAMSVSAVAAMLALTLVSRAGDTPKANPFLSVLSTTTQAELPAKAGDLVAQAVAKQQQQTTVDVVKAAVGLNPAAAALIVGSIAQTTPAMAAIAAGTAAGLVPDQAATIARAAAAAAPQQAGKIVEAICRMLPAAYSEVAEAVADVVPGAGKEILAGVSAAIPALKGAIDKALLAGNGGVPSVYAVLTQIESTQPSVSLGAGAAGGTMSRAFVAPVVKPPYVVPPTSPVNLNPGSGVQVPPGGRVYEDP